MPPVQNNQPGTGFGSRGKLVGLGPSVTPLGWLSAPRMNARGAIWAHIQIVSLRNLKLVIVLGNLNHLDIWGADIGNAYLEAFTDEKLYIVAGPEFQELEGYILVFLKALYGLKSSG